MLSVFVSAPSSPQMKQLCQVLVHFFMIVASSIAILANMVPKTRKGAPFDEFEGDLRLLSTIGALAFVSWRLGKLPGREEREQLRMLISLFVLGAILGSGERVSKVLTVGYEDIVRDVFVANSNSQYRWTALAITVPQLYFFLDLFIFIKPPWQCTNQKDRAKVTLLYVHHLDSLLFWFTAFYSTCGASIVGLGFLLTELGGLGKIMPRGIWRNRPVLYGIVATIYTIFRIELVRLGWIIISLVCRAGYKTRLNWYVYLIAVLSATMMLYSILSVGKFWIAVKKKWLAK